MKIHSSNQASAYLYALKVSLGSSTDFGIERFTGIILGKFFCVTHHSSYEWNRETKYEKNTAVGYVNKSKNGSDVNFITTKGELRPQMLLPTYLISFLISYIFTGNAGMGLYLSGAFTFTAILTAIYCAVSENGKAGKSSLLSLLMDPENPYNNVSCVLCTVTDIRVEYAYIQHKDNSAVLKVPLTALPQDTQTGQKLLFSNNEYTKI